MVQVHLFKNAGLIESSQFAVTISSSSYWYNHIYIYTTGLIHTRVYILLLFSFSTRI